MVSRITHELLILIVITGFAGLLFGPTPLSAAPQQINTIFLPIIITPAHVDPLQIISNVNCDTNFGDSVLSPAVFRYGIKQLGISTTVEGGIGQTWRLTWSKDGQPVSDLDKSGVIAQSLEEVGTTIIYGSNLQCGAALPQGMYQVRLFLDGSLSQTATITIQ